MVTRRTVLAGLAGAMLSQLESLVFFPGLGRTSSAIAQDTADGDEYHGFLLLPWPVPFHQMSSHLRVELSRGRRESAPTRLTSD